MKSAVALICCVVWATSASALPGDPACARLGRLASDLAADRDKGIPYKDKVKKINENPGAFYSDRDTPLRLAKIVYDIPSMTTVEAFKSVYIPCTLKR